MAEAAENWFPGMPLAQDVVSGIVVGGALGKVEGRVTFAFPIRQICTSQDEVLARPEWSTGAVLVERAVLSTNHGAIAAEPVFDRYYREVNADSSRRTVPRRDIGGPQQDRARFIRTGPRCPDLSQMSHHSGIAVSGIVSQRFVREMSKELADELRGGTIV